jgi:hypothetical protein
MQGNTHLHSRYCPHTYPGSTCVANGTSVFKSIKKLVGVVSVEDGTVHMHVRTYTCTYVRTYVHVYQVPDARVLLFLRKCTSTGSVHVNQVLAS